MLGMRAIEGPGEGEKIYTVSEITASVKDTIEREFPYLWVVGEISNCTFHSSGHIYFKIKDELAQLDCALFRSARQPKFNLQDGAKVLLQGRLGVYEKRGQYQMIVNVMLPMGQGDLYLAFNQLKARLEKEGFFDPSAKRPLPAFPQRLGVVTSPTGAAVRDVIRVARKIYSGIQIILRPARVQGEGAAEEIAQAVGDFNSAGGVDVIILARGGGSIEDLWAFNEEIVARAIRSSRIPVVSAVGHEIDFTIADFAADVRAPTPSAAPGIVLADYADVRTRLVSLVRRARSEVAGRIERDRRFLASLATRYGLRRMRDRLVAYARGLDEAAASVERLVETSIETRRSKLEGLLGRVESLSPLATLRRGYSVCFTADTSMRVTTYKQIKPGDRLRLVFAEGGAICLVERRDKETG